MAGFFSKLLTLGEDKQVKKYQGIVQKVKQTFGGKVYIYKTMS